MKKLRLLRITTVPLSLKHLLKGQLAYMQQRHIDVLAISADGPEVASVAAEGVRHEVVNMTRKITPVKDLGALMKLVGAMRRFRPDIVHSHTPKAGLLGMMAARIAGVPVRLHTVAGLPLMEASGMKRRLLVLTERITYFCATTVYVNSSGLLAYIEEHITRSDKFRIIGKGSTNGIDTDHYALTPEVQSAATALRAKLDISSDELVFCFVGRIVRDKGINELVEAFQRFTQERAARLILVGPFEDDLDPISEETRKILRDNKQITSLGYQSDVRVPLAASDIFVFPSYREGFPNVVMQACCMGLPCIVSDINGCNEIILDGQTGLVVKPKNVNALYTAMHRLALHTGDRKRYAAAAREFISANFSQQHVWNLIWEEYKSKSLVRIDH
jgi:glycosyltransferase involved in cell wall biosynthesis